MKQLLSALFSHRHEYSWPITRAEIHNGFRIRVCYRRCTECGKRIYFDPKNWRNVA